MRPCLPGALIPKENEHPERTGRNFKGHSEEHPLWSSLISRPSASPRGPFGNFLGLQPPGRQKQKIGDGSPKRGGRFVQQSGHRRAPLPEGTGPAEKPAATQERPKATQGRPAHWICPVPGRSRACTRVFSRSTSKKSKCLSWKFRGLVPRAQREAGTHQMGSLDLAGPKLVLEIPKISRNNFSRAPPPSRA